jgi:hypothetical protein
MLHRFGLTLTTIALTATTLSPLPCVAQAQLSYDHGGQGLRHQSATGAESPSGGDSPRVKPSRQPPDFTLFGGSRELTRGGPGATETYGGVAYALPRGWGSSFEAGYAAESVFVPRQYSLTGQVRTAMGDGRVLSVGIRYRMYDPDPGAREDPLYGYALTPSRAAGAGFAPGYQLQVGYQYSAFSLFELALSRDQDPYSPAFDPAIGYPRQLSFTGQHWLTPSWGLSYDVLTGDLGTASPLRLQGLGLRLGVRYRF